MKNHQRSVQAKKHSSLQIAQVSFSQAQGFSLCPLPEVLIPQGLPWPLGSRALLIRHGDHRWSLHATFGSDTLEVKGCVIADAIAEVFLNHIMAWSQRFPEFVYKITFFSNTVYHHNFKYHIFVPSILVLVCLGTQGKINNWTSPHCLGMGRAKMAASKREYHVMDPQVAGQFPCRG